MDDFSLKDFRIKQLWKMARAYTIQIRFAKRAQMATGGSLGGPPPNIQIDKGPSVVNPFVIDNDLPLFILNPEWKSRILWEIVTYFAFTLILVLTPLSFANNADLPTLSKGFIGFLDLIFLFDIGV
jgi:hypothetical protein